MASSRSGLEDVHDAARRQYGLYSRLLHTLQDLGGGEDHLRMLMDRMDLFDDMAKGVIGGPWKWIKNHPLGVRLAIDWNIPIQEWTRRFEAEISCVRQGDLSVQWEKGTILPHDVSCRYSLCHIRGGTDAAELVKSRDSTHAGYRELLAFVTAHGRDLGKPFSVLASGSLASNEHYGKIPGIHLFDPHKAECPAVMWHDWKHGQATREKFGPHYFYLKRVYDQPAKPARSVA